MVNDPYDKMPFEEGDDDKEVPSLVSTLRFAAPTVPLEWRNVPRDDWPYANARDEYLRSPHVISAPVLARRWVDLEVADHIIAFVCGPTAKQARAETQANLNAEASASPPTKAELERLNAHRRAQVGGEIDAAFFELDNNETVEVMQVFVKGKLETREVHKPLTSMDKARLRRGVGELIVTERLLNGEATEIFRVEVKTEELDMERLAREELEKNPRFATLQQIASLGAGEVWEGEEVLALPEAAPEAEGVALALPVAPEEEETPHDENHT